MSEDLRGPRIVLRACAAEHQRRLRELHSSPEVAQWWHLPDPDWPFDEEPDTSRYTVLRGEDVVGFVQWYAVCAPRRCAVLPPSGHRPRGA